jgi:hypothetical protein
MATARYAFNGAGTQTAGLGFGGSAAPGITAATEAWNSVGIQTITVS